MSHLKLSHPSQEGFFHASKWLKSQVLLDPSEMCALFEHLPPFSLYNISEVVSQANIDKQSFLDTYAQYIAALQRGEELENKLFRRMFSAVMSTDPEALYAMEVKPLHYLVKLRKPVVQMQFHQFLASSLDGKFHPMVVSKESISWGIQFSYPQIFQYPKPVEGKSFVKIRDSDDFPNTVLFDALLKWIRQFTTPTTFVWQGKKSATPFRLGKKCFNWIGAHSQLIKKEMHVLELKANRDY